MYMHVHVYVISMRCTGMFELFGEPSFYSRTFFITRLYYLHVHIHVLLSLSLSGDDGQGGTYDEDEGPGYNNACLVGNVQ